MKRFMSFARVAQFGGAASLVVVGCSSNHPTGEDVARQVGTAMCTKSQSCSPDAFAAKYPKGINDCVAPVIAAMGDQKDSLEACTQDEINQCTTDINALTCSDALEKGTKPASCTKC